MNAPRSRVIIPTTRRRDIIVAVCCGVGVLGFMAFAFFALTGEQGVNSTNQLTGTIVSKHFAGETENEISFGKKGLKSRVAETGYSFEIKVKSTPEHPNYEVPVSKALYDSRKIGDTQSFIRPPSEQK